MTFEQKFDVDVFGEFQMRECGRGRDRAASTHNSFLARLPSPPTDVTNSEFVWGNLIFKTMIAKTKLFTKFEIIHMAGVGRHDVREFQEARAQTSPHPPSNLVDRCT